MTDNFKVGTYVKKEDYNKLIIRGIVFGAVWLGIVVIVTGSWLAYINTTFTPEQDTINELTNQTSTSNSTFTEPQELLLAKMLAVGLLTIIMGPILIGLAIGWFAAVYVSELLGVTKWDVNTCRCCDKYVSTHEKIED